METQHMTKFKVLNKVTIILQSFNYNNINNNFQMDPNHLKKQLHLKTYLKPLAIKNPL